MGSDSYSFQKLTPVTDAELDIYEHAFNFVFNNNDVKNIAISGAYSSGKSSVIESYKKNNSEKRFLHISLAHFELESTENDKSSIKVLELEGKILNQLIHQIHPNKIPFHKQTSK